MDTPEKNQIGTPSSKFEDSPIFNYINSLSPIKPVKSLHITQAFSSLSFASLPSVFTSPHVSSHKESRFLRRYSSSDLSKPELSSENGNKVCTSEEVVVEHENCNAMVDIGEVSVEPHGEGSKFVIELPRTLKYDCGSPADCVSTPSGVEADFTLELVDPPSAVVPHVQEAPEKDSSDGETQYHDMCLSERKNDVTVCDWESLISDSADILIFNSPNRTESYRGLIQNSLEPATRFCTSLAAELNDEHHMQIVEPVGFEQENGEGPFSQTGDAGVLPNNPSEAMDHEAETRVTFSCKTVFSWHRGMRRRCLDFEMGGAPRKNLGDGSSHGSVLSQPDEKMTTNEEQLGPLRQYGDSSRRVLPGIGLHLNALAATSKQSKIIKSDILSSGIQIRSTASIRSPRTGLEALDESLNSGASEIDTNATENGVQLLQDASQVPGALASEDFNQNSPKKKRRKLESGETEGCKRCNCKKSKCLKLYCECFAAGVYCIEPCSCQECFNKPIHEETVLSTRKQIESRNPLAFAPKVIRSSDAVPEFGDESSKTPASARHKRGCNCKKSSCLKKYCECYQGGVGCSISCRCEGCKNAFGRKDGSSALIGTEAEPDEEETEACEKSLADKPSQKIEIHNNEEQNSGSAHPMTPLRMSRALVPLPFSSKGKPPRSSFITVASSSSGLYSQKHAKPSILRSQPKFEKHMQTIPDDEMPVILRGDGSPSTGIKTVSPNSKRISPPHCHFGSPGRRSGRKLILQSIPSFPSLTPQH